MTRTFAQIIRQHALERPQAPALTFDGATLSFAQLHVRSSQAANALARAGVRAGDRVALAVANMLVGNPPDRGAIEFTVMGGTFMVEGGAVRVALAGAPAGAADRLDRKKNMNRPAAAHAMTRRRTAGPQTASRVP